MLKICQPEKVYDYEVQSVLISNFVVSDAVKCKTYRHAAHDQVKGIHQPKVASN